MLTLEQSVEIRVLARQQTSIREIARQMGCSRHSSGTGLPASACMSTAMIWLSENLDFFIL
jgi:transposase